MQAWLKWRTWPWITESAVGRGVAVCHAFEDKGLALDVIRAHYVSVLRLTILIRMILVCNDLAFHRFSLRVLTSPLNFLKQASRSCGLLYGLRTTLLLWALYKWAGVLRLDIAANLLGLHKLLLLVMHLRLRFYAWFLLRCNKFANLRVLLNWLWVS